MSKKTPWIFVDCEARGTSPVHGVLTEFGAVHYDTRDTFYGRLFEATPDPENPAISVVGERIAADKEVAESFAAWLQEHLGNSQPVFVSDNPAYDWQWIAGMFDRAGMDKGAALLKGLVPCALAGRLPVRKVRLGRVTVADRRSRGRKR
jgi:hypothetical protein